MKNALYTLVVLIIAGIILAIINPKLSKDKSDIRYVLGPSVPIETLKDGYTIYAQQLNIYNIGDVEAKNLLISLRGDITSVDVPKDIEKDVFSIYKEGIDITNISYSSLLPARSLRISIRTKSKGISSSEIYISHSQGKGKEGLEIGYGYLIKALANFAVIVYVLFTLVWVLYGAKSLYVERLERQVKHESLYILKKKRPIIISKEKWSKLRYEAIDVLTSIPYHFSKLEDTFCYKILNSEKGDYLSVEEWETILSRADKAMVELYERQTMMEIYNHEKLIDILKIPKPENITDSTWNKIVKNFSDSFVYSKLRKIKYLSSLSSNLLEDIKANRPNGITQKSWDEYIAYLQTLYIQNIYYRLYLSVNPIEYLDNQDKSVLDNELLVDMGKRAYEIMISKYFIRDKDDAKKFLELEKPEWMIKGDYDKLVDTAKKIQKLDIIIEENESLKKRLYSDSINLAERVELLDKKLEFLHKLLNEDPSVIDRVEDHTNLFSVGNYENLKKLATYIKKLAASKEI
ncbi:MAG: hypothetical protein A2W09_04275 [Deltaproteobacteria bacterium RBG_16_50_11]|nr:MAG: hypothetical protein A2W09_04275 [Deltaproteobacteria bacterium RBG_16_50_11]